MSWNVCNFRCLTRTTLSCRGCAVLVQSWALHGPLLSSILSIDLSSNKIGPEGAALLGTGIATASFALKELSVEDNSILDRGAAGLLEVRFVRSCF